MSSIYKHSDIKTLATGIDHSEGICAGLNGEIFLGSESGKIYRLSIGQKPEIVAESEVKGILLGLTIRKNGNLLVCDAAAKKVWEVDTLNGTWNIFCDEVNGMSLNVPNWGCFLPDGSYVFSDSGDWKKSDGKIIRVDSNKNSTIWSNKLPNFPNGIAVSKDGNELIVLESTPGKVSTIRINDDYSAGEVSTLFEMEAVPDGVTVTSTGALVISCYRPDIIYIWEDGKLDTLIEDIEGTFVAAPTNTILTGPNRNLLVWPNFGRWDLAMIESNLVGHPLLVFQLVKQLKKNPHD